jgi:hypothetical protein
VYDDIHVDFIAIDVCIEHFYNSGYECDHDDCRSGSGRRNVDGRG